METTANSGSLVLCSCAAPPCSLRTPRVLPHAPSVLPLKRPCSLTRLKRVVSNPKFGVYMIYIYNKKSTESYRLIN